MADADKLAAEAARADAQEAKPLPALVSPMTRLSPSIRNTVAVHCRDEKKSFSVITELMWFERLKKLGKIKADLQPEVRKAVSEGLRVKLTASEAKVEASTSRIKELEKMLEAAKQAKK